MTAYDQIISRADSGSDPLVPEPVSAQVIQELPTQSAILSRARSVPLSSKTQRQPVLDVLPQAYFVGGGDTGLKQTTRQAWANVDLVVEEIACIVPIPESYLDDAQIPIWDEVRPRMTESVGALIDGAALFGVSKPSTWSTSIYDAALAAGNYTVQGSGAGFGVDTADLGELLAEEGFNVDGFASRPGLSWKLVGLRSAEGLPIYQPNLQTGGTGNLYGYPLSEVKNGSWDASKAQLIAGEWDKAIVGMRSDISFKMFTEGVISDNTGKVILNLMQQDSVAMRVTMRLAFATANPVTALQSDSATRYPFGFVATTDPSESSSSSS